MVFQAYGSSRSNGFSRSGRFSALGLSRRSVGSIFFFQFSQSIDSKEKADDSLAFDEQFDHHQLSRRSSKKVAQMLQQILQRGEVQVEPYRIHKFLGRLQRRKSNDLLSSLKIWSVFFSTIKQKTELIETEIKFLYESSLLVSERKQNNRFYIEEKKIASSFEFVSPKEKKNFCQRKIHTEKRKHNVLLIHR